MVPTRRASSAGPRGSTHGSCGVRISSNRGPSTPSKTTATLLPFLATVARCTPRGLTTYFASGAAGPTVFSSTVAAENTVVLAAQNIAMTNPTFSDVFIKKGVNAACLWEIEIILKRGGGSKMGFDAKRNDRACQAVFRRIQRQSRDDTDAAE